MPTATGFFYNLADLYTPMPSSGIRTLSVVSVVLVTLLVISGVRPYDRTTWILEVFPVILALPVMWVTVRRFPLTTLLYACIFVHAAVLLLGGAYTYSRVPLGFWLQSLFHLSRNPYDKVGHFFQGLVPALVSREILIRGRYVRGKPLTAFLAVCIALAVSATYELIEWLAALALGSGADEFLGTQGDPWDTQSDVLMALIGALSALWFLGRAHDRQIAAITAAGD